MNLCDFQLACLVQANHSTDEKAQKCYRDCVNYSGDLIYELSASGQPFNDDSVIERTIGYQLTRYEVPFEVSNFMRNKLVGLQPIKILIS